MRADLNGDRAVTLMDALIAARLSLGDLKGAAKGVFGGKRPF